MLVYFMAIRNILWPSGIFCGHWVYFSGFGMLYREKSGNPELLHSSKNQCTLQQEL
jgi:hypothetical protein